MKKVKKFTIDEAIKKERQIIDDCSKSIIFEMEDLTELEVMLKKRCLDKIQYHTQICEWLEQLKEKI